MSSRKATASWPASKSSGPTKPSTALLAFALLILLNCITSSATLSTSAGSDKPDSSLAANGDNQAVVTGEIAPQMDKLSPLVKRAAPRMYNFGLGKRIPSSENALAWKLMLGNNFNEFKQLVENNPEFFRPIEQQSSKRSKPQRFSFGLGKRSDEVLAPDADSADEAAPGQESLGDYYEKRKADRYSFGLGKRFSLFGKSQYPRNLEELYKRRYNFGLGK